ncbi:hypothetical protein NQ317_002937 [Molorchus minor]|uniref:X-box-binding protein 1 n=1 Tax=Molorchus minor TaxID=1323400 RepID=A0ABQ9J2S2_9CUCU|nr:hypothetical protein NQ317_002937 [Molorchus minor]
MTAAAVPTILKYLKNNQDYTVDQNMDVSQRAKKRRLDHLTWEEKMQRKKLKNRVAAQTSRDRKKAKQEEMEQAIQQLFSQNESLLAECENLKHTNQKLTEENTELYNRLQTPCLNCSQSRTVVCEALNGSAASLLLPKGRATHTAASLSQQLEVAVKVTTTYLLCLTYLLNSIQMSTFVPWNSSPRASSRISPGIWRQQQRVPGVRMKTKLRGSQSESDRHISNTKVVGTTSEELESSGCDMLKDKKSIESDISEYLLLHHNYAKPPKYTRKIKTPVSKRKLKVIKPKVDHAINKNELPVDAISLIVAENNAPLFENYDCLTVVAATEGSTNNENVIEVVTEGSEHAEDNTLLTVPSSQMMGGASPIPSSHSDYGYESLGSPSSLSELDIWDASVSELFPSLML